MARWLGRNEQTVSLILCGVCRAQDAYYSIPLDKLTLTEGQLPSGSDIRWRYWSRHRAMRAYAVIDAGGEAVVMSATSNEPWRPAQLREGTLVIQCTARAQISGMLFAPKDDGSGMVRLPFKVAPEPFKTERKEFLRAQLSR